MKQKKMDTIFYNKSEALEGDGPKMFVARPDQFRSAVDFRVLHPKKHRESVFVLSNNLDIPSESPYNIFSGKSTRTLDSQDKEAVSEYRGILYDAMINFLKAGYHREKSLIKISDWCVNFTEPIMQYLLTYFEIETEAEDINIVDQFLSTPQLRKLITEILVEVLAHYSINNEIISNSDVSDWYDVKMWEELKTYF